MAKTTEDMMQELFGPVEQEEPKVGVDPDVPTVEPSEPQELSEGDILTELFGPAPEVSPEVSPEVDTSAIPTSYSGFYGEDLLRREQELLSTQMGPGGTGEFTQVEEALGQRPAFARELADIKQQKKDKYDAVQGENVTTLDINLPGDVTIYGGKIITDPDGTKRFLPPPTATESTQMVDKMILDTARGIAGLPEFFGIEGFQKAVPEIASEDEAAIIMAELGQLTFGGLGVLKLAERGPKIYALAEKLPAFRAFAKYAEDMTPDFVKRGIDYAKLGLQGVEKTVPEGTIPVAVGAAVVADEDVGTLFGSPDMTMAEAKTRMLAETMAFGVVWNMASTAGEVTRLAPGLNYLGRNIKSGVTALFANPEKMDEAVMEQLGEVVYRNSKKLAAAQTQDEVDQAYLELYDEIQTTYKKATGKDLNEVLLGDELPPPQEGEYVPSIGEVFDDEALMRLYKGLATKGGARQADQILSQMLNDAEMARLQALKERAQIGEATLAPRGEEAGVEAREALEPQIAEEQAAVARVGREEVEEARTETERMLAESQAREEAAMVQAEAQRVGAEETVIATAEDVQRVLRQSPASKTNLDALDQTIADDGAMQTIDQVLADDLTTVREAGRAKDEAFRTVEIPPEEAIDLTQRLLARIGNEDFIRANPQAASAMLSKLIRTFRDDTVQPVPGPAPTPTPGAPTPTPRPPTGIQQELAQLQDELEQAVTAQDILRISQRISQLLRRGARPVSEGIEEGVEELPTITLADLDLIAMDAKDASNKAFQASRSPSRGGAQKRVLYTLGEDLRGLSNEVSATVDQYVVANPQVKEVRDEFGQVFSSFRERWRTQTGNDWQGDIIQSTTEADIAKVSNKIISVFKNPNTTDANLIQIRNIVNQMPEEVREPFIQQIGTRILADFTRAKGIMPAVDSVQTVADARRLISTIDEYLQGVSRYENVMPGALQQLRDLRTSLEGVTAGAEAAVARRGATEAEARAAERAARATGEAERRALSAQERDQIAEISRRMKEAQSAINNSTLKQFLNVDNPTDFVSRLYRDQRGAQKFQELWTRAGTTGEKLESGLTPAQEALKETAMKGLLMRVYTPTQEAVDAGRMALMDVVDATTRPNSTAGQIFAIATDGDPAAREFMEQFKNSIASYQRSLTGGQIPGSRTAETAALQRLTNDVLMVVYGPLTQNFRIARFIANATFKSQAPEEKIAEAWGRVMTDPRYYKGVLDKAKTLAEQKLIPEQEAFSLAFAAGLLSAAGYNKYMQSEDPEAEILRDYRQYATVQQTEEALQENPATPE